ncbi:CaiB/BaiF CoA transferase family protein [Rhodococcus aetherivorans]|uniref:CaiB/BaiF CoA transferase family protein n=1 Tax=Rhodococcus aetherivorans TaxID=191292 RepID=UPI00045CA7AE|nr:CoA transferase [Rhodococcus aetherivorans]KDE12233.1 carnitine dehydratase [Rhodococcus aetherivorans]
MTFGALSGLKVIDLSRVLAGPYCTQMLGDHGATVIKVEPPAGDMTREWGPPFENGTSAYYRGLNRNKQHCSLNLTEPEAREILRRMLADADVVVENFKAGTMTRWGLGPETLLEDFPQLVYCRITGFGVDGPMGGYPGYDAVLQAFAGIMDMTGEPDRPPVKVPMPIVDQTTGMLALSGILMALFARQRTGTGQLVDVTLLDAAISLLHPATANYFMDGQDPERLGSGHPNVAPYETFGDDRTRLFVGGGNDRQFQSLCRYLGAPELAQDPRFRTNGLRIRNRSALSHAIAELLEKVDLDSAADDMLAHGVPASRVQKVSEVARHPQVLHRQMVVEVDGSSTLGVPVKLDRTPGAVKTMPRQLGHDTRAVLHKLGYTDHEVGRFVASGVARCVDDVDASAPSVNTTR